MFVVAAGKTNWGSQFGFLMAAIGFAVGLGNIWRFPYMTGENGGAAFVFVYLICAIGIGVPILIAEIMIGRRGGMSPPGAIANVATESGRTTHWSWVGRLNLATAFLIEVVYCVVAGWVLYYLYQAITTGFAGVDSSDANVSFNAMVGDPWLLSFWTVVGLSITGAIVYSGVNKGIENAVRILMPMLFVLLVVIAIYNAFSDGFAEAVAYLATPDFSKVNGDMVLDAIGQAFFSVGVAMAGMMTFGAYLPRDISIAKSATIIILADTGVALVAGLVIFPLVFRFGLDPAGGAGLIFMTLPQAFAGMEGGIVIAILFFLLLSVAAITSMVGLIEPVVRFTEETLSRSRHQATLMVVAAIFVLSTISNLAYNHWSEIAIVGIDINTGLDYLTNNLMLTLGGFFIAVFAGWAMTRSASQEELAMQNSGLFSLWHFLIRFVVPIAVAVIFVVGVL